MSLEDLSAAAQDYLKVIWTASEWSQEPVTTSLLAARLGVSASTASEAIRRLTDLGLVDHAPYRAVTLTDAGRELAVTMVRRHRLLESFLVDTLGYTWDEVHDEAEVLEHAVSDRMIERIASHLGNPIRDPHGDPIPTADGRVPRPAARRLADLAADEDGLVARISDADPEVLRYFDEIGIALDVRVRVAERRDHLGVLRIDLDGSSVDLGMPAAEAVWLAAAPRGDGDGRPANGR